MMTRPLMRATEFPKSETHAGGQGKLPTAFSHQRGLNGENGRAIAG